MIANPPVLLAVVSAYFSGGADLGRPPCEVRLVPDDASERWKAAAQQLQNELRVVDGADGDCSQVMIRVVPAPESTSVEVTTHDGRHAVRSLVSISDLEPTVAALVVTVDPDSGAPRAGDQPGVVVTGPSAIVAARSWQLVLTGSAGTRVRFSDSGARPTVELELGVIGRGWEGALVGGWSSGASSATHVLPPNVDPPTNPGPVGTSIDLSVSVARRIPISVVDLLLGVRAGVARLSPASVTFQGQGAMAGTQDSTLINNPVIEPLVGAFAAASIPVWSYLRLRPQLLFQWAIPAATSSTQTDDPLSRWTPVHAWSAGLTIGLESRVP